PLPRLLRRDHPPECGRRAGGRMAIRAAHDAGGSAEEHDPLGRLRRLRGGEQGEPCARQARRLHRHRPRHHDLPARGDSPVAGTSHDHRRRSRLPGGATVTSPATPPPPAAAGPWTTRRLLDWMTGAFESKGLDEPRLCAEMLLAHTLGCQRLRLYMEADRPATDAERERLRTLVGRALKHEPIQYLIGRWPFFGIELKCDRPALIPRPSTETIVEGLLPRRRGGDGPPK